MSVFELAWKNYARGLWTGEMLKALAAKGLLGENELQMIIHGDKGAKSRDN